MKGILLFVLFFISAVFSYDYINGDDFYLENVFCHAEHEIIEADGYDEFIFIQCDNNYKFEANAAYLASSNNCFVTKVAGRDTIKYGIYYKNNNKYEYVKDEYGIVISVKQVNLDCVDIYKKFKSKIIGRIRTSTFKCNDGACYTYYDDGTKKKFH